MIIKPKDNYVMPGLLLDKNKTYNATIATNQPNYKEKGLIFVCEMLLSNEEYEIIEN